MRSVLREFHPEAVFCGNDYMAAGALKSLHESGIRVPEQVAIVGYDNNDVCLGVVPSLTTVDAHHDECGINSLVHSLSTFSMRSISSALKGTTQICVFAPNFITIFPQALSSGWPLGPGLIRK